MRPDVTTLLLSAVLLPAQEPARALVGGTVQARDGGPLADARVVLIGRPLNWGPHPTAAFDPLDRIEVRSDSSGRFRARLLAAVTYSAWAELDPDPQGRVRITGIAERVTAGDPLILREVGTRRPRRVRLTDTGPWQAAGPLGLVAAPDAFTHLQIPLRPAADGVFTVPPLPGVRLLAVDRRSEVLQLLPLSDRPRTDRPESLALLPARSIPVRVTDPAGQPVAGAVLHHRSLRAMFGDHRRAGFRWPARDHWRQLGVTDADGTCTVRIPLREDPFAATGQPDLVLRAGKAGYAQSHSGWSQRGRFVDGKVLSDPPKVRRLDFTLHPAQPIEGRVLWSDKAPAAGLPLLLMATCKIATGGGWTHLPRTFAAHTDAAGHYRVPDLPLDAYNLELIGALSEAAVTSRFPGQRPPALLNRLTLPPLPKRRARLPDFRVSRTRTVRLAVVDQTGGPPAGCFGVIVPVQAGTDYLPAAPWEFQMDRGRLTALLLPGAYVLMVAGRNGWLCEDLEVLDKPTPVSLRLGAYAVMHGQAFLGDRPLRGGQVDLVQYGFSHDDQQLSRLKRSLIVDLNRLLLNTPVDTDGRFRCRFVPVNTASYKVQIRSADGRHRSDRLALAPGERRVQLQE